jgi:hypothetical protein
MILLIVKCEPTLVFLRPLRAQPSLGTPDPQAHHLATTAPLDHLSTDQSIISLEY